MANEELILLNTLTDDVMRLNESARYCVMSLLGGAGQEEVISILQDRLNKPAEEVKGSVHELIETLVGKGWLTK